MATPTPLTNLNNLHAIFGINPTDTTQDALLNLYITQASAILSNWCDCTFATNTWTEYYSGNNQTFLVLNDRPVLSVTSVYENENLYYGTPSSDDLLNPGEDYVLELDSNDGASHSGSLIRISGVWIKPYGYKFGLVSSVPEGATGNIQVTYVAGYASVPYPVQTACELLIAKMRQTRLYGQSVQSKSFGDRVSSASVSLAPAGNYGLLTPEITSLLAPYRKIEF